jgi:hypothetical protein
LGKLFDEYVQGKNTYPEKTREFDIVKKTQGAKTVKLTMGTELHKPEIQGCLTLGEMDFVAVKNKPPQKIEITGSSHLFYNPKEISNEV